MQRISVDLPEPDGPQITMRSPGRTSRSMSVRTWNCPNHLPTFSMWMMGSVLHGVQACCAADQLAGMAGSGLCSHF